MLMDRYGFYLSVNGTGASDAGCRGPLDWQQEVVEAAGIEPVPGFFSKLAAAHDFRCQGSMFRRIRCLFESPGVPSSPLESTPVLETFWRRAMAIVSEVERPSDSTWLRVVPR